MHQTQSISRCFRGAGGAWLNFQRGVSTPMLVNGLRMKTMVVVVGRRFHLVPTPAASVDRSCDGGSRPHRLLLLSAQSLWQAGMTGIDRSMFRIGAVT